MTENLPALTEREKNELRYKSLKDVATRLLPEAKYNPENAHLIPPMPKQVEVTDEVAQAIKDIAKLFNKVVPETGRALESQERAHMMAEQEALAVLIKMFTARQENIKEYVRNHNDATAEATYAINTHGHYVTCQPQQPTVIDAPGHNEHWSLEYTAGKVAPKAQRLRELYENGEIDHKTWLALTDQVREPNEDKIRDHVLKTGDLSLLDKLTERGPASYSVNIRGVK